MIFYLFYKGGPLALSPIQFLYKKLDDFIIFLYKLLFFNYLIKKIQDLKSCKSLKYKYFLHSLNKTLPSS